jgi:hypothetical protein
MLRLKAQFLLWHLREIKDSGILVLQVKWPCERQSRFTCKSKDINL